MKSVLERARIAACLIRDTLREIFDESAYERYLHRNGIQHSAVSYRQFMREREIAITTRPRCC